MEAALTAALAAVGLPLAAVATAVLACRLASFWAVVAGGRIVFFFLRRGDRLSRQAQDGLPPAWAGTGERPVAGAERSAMNRSRPGMPPPAPWWAMARGRGVPWWGAVCSAAAGLRPRVSATASVLMLGVLVWFGAELITGGGLGGLAERVLGGTLTLWPPLVVLSCRRGQPPAAAARRTDAQIRPLRQAGSGHHAASTGHDGRSVAQPR